jgi:5-methylcytosine-specific restriction endonuclease McrA
MTEQEKIQYREFLQTEEWKRRRNEILTRDGHACRNCGSTALLHVHHRQYHRDAVTRRILPPWDYTDHLLITLCERCHQKGHERYYIPEFETKTNFKSLKP